MAYNQKIMRMKELIEKLTEADIAYYKNDDPIMTDREYDYSTNLQSWKLKPALRFRVLRRRKYPAKFWNHLPLSHTQSRCFRQIKQNP